MDMSHHSSGSLSYYYIRSDLIHSPHFPDGVTESRGGEEITQVHSWQEGGERFQTQCIALHSLTLDSCFWAPGVPLISLFTWNLFLGQWRPAALWECPLHLQHCPESHREGQLHSHSRGHQRCGGAHVCHLGQGCGKDGGHRKAAEARSECPVLCSPSRLGALGVQMRPQTCPGIFGTRWFVNFPSRVMNPEGWVLRRPPRL